MDSNLIIQLLIFCASLAVLIYSAGQFINSAEKIGLSLGIPSFVIGVTVVALGTSLPELVSSIIAILDGSPGIVIGNVVGSNITNILLVLGAVAVIAKQFDISFNFKKIDLPFFIIAAAFLYITCRDQDFTIVEGIIGLVVLVAYIVMTVKSGKVDEPEAEKTPLKPSTFLFLLLGGVGIYLGAKYNVSSVINIGDILNLPAAIIALTAVALGTSLPELFVSIAAIRKNNAEIAVGNVLGSNIFNSLAIMGIPRFVGALEIPKEVANISIPIMLASTILFIAFTWNKKVNWMAGIVLLAGYVAFIYFSFFS